jgi:hypothetical protein
MAPKQLVRAVAPATMLLAIAACSKAQSDPPPGPPPPSSGWSVPPIATATAAPAPSSSASAEGERIRILPEEGPPAGLPAIGFSLAGVWRGFARNARPQAGTYLSLGGPPGGTLMFVVKGYRDADPTQATLERLFDEWTKGIPGLEAGGKGAPETLRLAGAQRPALAYVVGRSMATANWCVSLVPSPKDPRQGLFVLMGVGAPEGARPDCSRSTSNERLRPLMDSLAVD